MPYEGKIISPPNGTTVAFGESIQIEGHAWHVKKDGTQEPVDQKIAWRHQSGGGYGATGPVTTLVFDTRRNTNVAMYAPKSNVVAKVKLNVICGAIEEVERAQGAPVSDDQYALALLMIAEAGTTTGRKSKQSPDAERFAVGATVVNRWRKYPRYFSGTTPKDPPVTLRGIIESKANVFEGPKLPVYKDNIGDRDHLRATMNHDYCAVFARALAQAKTLLETSTPITPSGCTAPPYFFINKTNPPPPERKQSPVVHRKGDDGWLHWFWGWTGHPGGP